ncbi:insulinase family protein [Shewanella sp. MMG014]|uniref:insulinase family protein n=1 Tax=Shewanella sp. MMG014 TaxID=2822691 RepID=UPI001B361572|nr:insulinase family protein [Shewanella sp. MMG014]MBQ4889626.1 insulinase family protein [Shewanella sp. MMG014]
MLIQKNKHPKLIITSSMIMLALMTLGCQHSPIHFTEAQAPNIPSFDVPENHTSASNTSTDLSRLLAATQQAQSKAIKPVAYQLPHTITLTKQFHAHQWPSSAVNDSGLNRLYLIGISAQQPITHPDILVEAFKQKLEEMANTTSYSPQMASCLSSIKIRASLHSVGMTIECSATDQQLQQQLWQFWQKGALSDINIATVKRNLKLNKHIGAFTGSEIDTTFRQQLLGQQHPYNLNVRNQSAINELDNTTLQTLHNKIRQQLQWHLFIPSPITSATHGVAQSSLNSPLDSPLNSPLNSQLNNLSSSTSTSSANKQNATITNSDIFVPTWLATTQPNLTKIQPNIITNSTGSATKQSTQTILIIDAKDAVQTQARAGFVLAKPDLVNTTNHHQNSTDCKTIAALLGRSYSGRLFYDLRETRGLTYGIYGRCVDAPLSQYLYFYGSTSLENSGAFLKGIIDHTQLLKEQAAKQTEINAVITYLMGKQQLASDHKYGKESRYINNLLLGRTASFEQLQHETLNSLTPKAITTMANHVFEGNPVIVLRGDADKIIPDLNEKLPHWQVITISP